MARILIIEDDPALRDLLDYNLKREGYDTRLFGDGTSGLEAFKLEKPDLVILDIMLPGLDGFEVCRLIRRESQVPIIMLTAREQEMDKVMGLELGADDYVTKPFSLKEFLARVRARLRRKEIPEGGILKAGEIEIDIGRHRVTKGNVLIELSPKEFDLLVFLVNNKGSVFSREKLLEEIWDYEYGGDSRTVDVHMRYLRKKLEDDPESPVYLVTVRGFGYKFV